MSWMGFRESVQIKAKVKMGDIAGLEGMTGEGRLRNRGDFRERLRVRVHLLKRREWDSNLQEAIREVVLEPRKGDPDPYRDLKNSMH
jgi:hypothetical protein